MSWSRSIHSTTSTISYRHNVAAGSVCMYMCARTCIYWQCMLYLCLCLLFSRWIGPEVWSGQNNKQPHRVKKLHTHIYTSGRMNIYIQYFKRSNFCIHYKWLCVLFDRSTVIVIVASTQKRTFCGRNSHVFHSIMLTNTEKVEQRDNFHLVRQNTDRTDITKYKDMTFKSTVLTDL